MVSNENVANYKVLDLIKCWKLHVRSFKDLIFLKINI